MDFLPRLRRWVRRHFLRFYASLFRSRRHLTDIEILFRGINPIHFDKGRITSAAFHDSSIDGKMSVDVASMTTADRSLKKLRKKGFGLASFTVGLARSLNQRVAHEPVPLNHAHGSVIGRKSQGVRRKFARNARWERLPSANQ